MAYSGNQLSLISNTMAMFNAPEAQLAIYAYVNTVDSLATVLAANYISDGQKRGLTQGDLVLFSNGTTLYVLAVVALQATASGYGVTLAQVAASSGSGVQVANSAVTTNVGATLTAAQLNGGLITRTGPTAAFSDTTDTAANIIAAMNSQIVGNSWTMRVINNTAFAETILGGNGVTVSGSSVVPPNSWVEFQMTYSGAGAVTMYGYAAGSNVNLPMVKFTTGALTAATLTAAQITGGEVTVLQNTGATPGAQTLPAASVLFAGIPNCQAGFSYILRIVNTGAGTLTLTADVGATIAITGHAAVVTNTFVDYVVTFLSGATATVQSIGSGVSP